MVSIVRDAYATSPGFRRHGEDTRAEESRDWHGFRAAPQQPRQQAPMEVPDERGPGSAPDGLGHGPGR
jgi:hypothetical protein